MGTTQPIRGKDELKKSELPPQHQKLFSGPVWAAHRPAYQRHSESELGRRL